MTDRIEELLSKYMLDPEAMDVQDAQELSDWIKQDRRHARKFIDSVLFRRDIHDLLLSSDNSISDILLNPPDVKENNADSAIFDKELIHSLLENELSAPEVEIENKCIEIVEDKVTIPVENDGNTV